MTRIDKVCVIDDDDIYQYLLRKELKSTKIVDQILVFPDGAKAIQYMVEMKDQPEELPDVVLLDVNMPVMNGWQFLDEFRLLKPSLHKKIAVLMVSSSIDPQDIELAKKYAVVTDYIVKPVTRHALVSMLEAL